VPNQLTIGEFIIGILPDLRRNTRMPSWPPDCFGLCLALLRQTGAYAQLLTDWPPGPTRGGALKTWTDKVHKLSQRWRRSWQAGGSFDDLADEWQIICQSFDVPLGQTREKRTLCEALMTLTAVADEACEGVGSPRNQAPGEVATLADVGTGFLTALGTLCLDIDRSRLRVLPRMHTPQNGLTERSLSHYLSLCEASEVTPQWLSNSFLPSDSMNLLLIPGHSKSASTNFERQQIPLPGCRRVMVSSPIPMTRRMI
jgi:hypothetical protein